jgi:hypothetical protein
MVMTLRTTCFSAFAAAALMATASTGAQANIEAGGLTCHSPGGVGYVVAAVLNVECIFTPSVGGPVHRYVGVIRRYGVDLGVTQNMALGWVVFAPTGAVQPGDLAGVYGGVQGNASFIVGGGANALIGGSNNTFALQPVSAEGQVGVNVSAGVTGLELQAVAGPVVPGAIVFRHHHHHHHRH